MGHTPHLHIPRPWAGPVLELSTPQRQHLVKVLRISDGEPLSYTDGSGITGNGRLDDSHLLRGEESSIERPTDLTVAVAPPSSRHRTRFLVEKLAELGVARLLWVRTRHTEGRPPPVGKAQAWSIAGMEQSRGGWLMKVTEARLEDLRPERLVVADPAGSEPFPLEGLTLLVGPEGGLDHDEIPEGARRVSLGPTTLRVETAAVVGATLLRLPDHG